MPSKRGFIALLRAAVSKTQTWRVGGNPLGLGSEIYKGYDVRHSKIVWAKHLRVTPVNFEKFSSYGFNIRSIALECLQHIAIARGSELLFQRFKRNKALEVHSVEFGRKPNRLERRDICILLSEKFDLHNGLQLLRKQCMDMLTDRKIRRRTAIHVASRMRGQIL